MPWDHNGLNILVHVYPLVTRLICLWISSRVEYAVLALISVDFFICSLGAVKDGDRRGVSSTHPSLQLWCILNRECSMITGWEPHNRETAVEVTRCPLLHLTCLPVSYPVCWRFFPMHDMTLGLKFVGTVLDCCWECSFVFHNFILRNNYQIIDYTQKIKRNSYLQTEHCLERPTIHKKL